MKRRSFFAAIAALCVSPTLPAVEIGTVRWCGVDMVSASGMTVIGTIDRLGRMVLGRRVRPGDHRMAALGERDTPTRMTKIAPAPDSPVCKAGAAPHGNRVQSGAGAIECVGVHRG